MSHKPLLLLVSLLLLGVLPLAADRERPLPFLAKIPEFKTLTLAITEPTLRTHAQRHRLFLREQKAAKGKSFWMITPAGENLIVMFGDDKKCRGIQRMRWLPKAALRASIGEADFLEWMKKLGKSEGSGTSESK